MNKKEKCYFYCSEFINGFAIVILNDKCSYINENLEEITDIKYDNCNHFSEGLGKVELHGKCGFVNEKGEEIIPLKYDNCSDFHNGFAVAFTDKIPYFYIINKEGKEYICNNKIIKGLDSEKNDLYIFYNTELNITFFLIKYIFAGLNAFKKLVEKEFNNKENKEDYNQYMKIIKEYEQ